MRVAILALYVLGAAFLTVAHAYDDYGTTITNERPVIQADDGFQMSTAWVPTWRHGFVRWSRQACPPDWHSPLPENPDGCT